MILHDLSLPTHLGLHLETHPELALRAAHLHASSASPLMESEVVDGRQQLFQNFECTPRCHFPILIRKGDIVEKEVGPAQIASSCTACFSRGTPERQFPRSSCVSSRVLPFVLSSEGKKQAQRVNLQCDDVRAVLLRVVAQLPRIAKFDGRTLACRDVSEEEQSHKNLHNEFAHVVLQDVSRAHIEIPENHQLTQHDHRSGDGSVE